MTGRKTKANAPFLFLGMTGRKAKANAPFLFLETTGPRAKVNFDIRSLKKCKKKLIKQLGNCF